MTAEPRTGIGWGYRLTGGGKRAKRRHKVLIKWEATNYEHTDAWERRLLQVGITMGKWTAEADTRSEETTVEPPTDGDLWKADKLKLDKTSVTDLRDSDDNKRNNEVNRTVKDVPPTTNARQRAHTDRQMASGANKYSGRKSNKAIRLQPLWRQKRGGFGLLCGGTRKVKNNNTTSVVRWKRIGGLRFAITETGPYGTWRNENEEIQVQDHRDMTMVREELAADTEERRQHHWWRVLWTSSQAINDRKFVQKPLYDKLDDYLVRTGTRWRREKDLGKVTSGLTGALVRMSTRWRNLLQNIQPGGALQRSLVRQATRWRTIML